MSVAESELRKVLYNFVSGRFTKSELEEMLRNKGVEAGCRKSSMVNMVLNLYSPSQLLEYSKIIKRLRWYEKLILFILLSGSKTKNEIARHELVPKILSHKIPEASFGIITPRLLEEKEASRRYPNYHIRVGAGGTGYGPFAAMPHGPGGYSGRRIKEGDVIVNVIGVRLNMYGVENERTFIVGKPTEKQKQFFEVATKAQVEALKICIEGNKVSDIDAVAQKIIEEAGYGDYVMHRTGHGIGLGGHEYWDDMAFNHRILKAGMVTSVEPGIYIYGFGGFRHSDTVIVGKTEPESATKYTKELEDLIVQV